MVNFSSQDIDLIGEFAEVEISRLYQFAAGPAQRDVLIPSAGVDSALQASIVCLPL